MIDPDIREAMEKRSRAAEASKRAVQRAGQEARGDLVERLRDAAAQCYLAGQDELADLLREASEALR